MSKIYNICAKIYYVNEQFQKDCILIPYAFYQVFGIEPVIVTARKEKLIYAASMPGLVVDIVDAPAEDSMELWIAQMKQYVLQHIEDMDILFCFGSYELYEHIVPYYKNLRPDGKVIMKLDMNSFWQDKISMQDQAVRRLYDHCDLITCESKKMKCFLSDKWPYEIDYVTNGYLTQAKESVPESDRKQNFDDKENVILTVGRIGADQKSNYILLDAFAQIADKHTDWKLKLVGSIDPQFQLYIDQYWTIHPELKDRVLFMGKIIEKQKLREEYRKAKIFAITSFIEGGTPNVFQEAAMYGCYMVCSEIDAADEFTNWGQCGKTFPIGDTNQLATILNQIMAPEYMDKMRQASVEVMKYRNRYYDYSVQVKKMMYLLDIKKER